MNEFRLSDAEISSIPKRIKDSIIEISDAAKLNKQICKRAASKYRKTEIMEWHNNRETLSITP